MKYSDKIVSNLVEFVNSKNLSDKGFEQATGWSNGFYGKVKNNKIAFSIEKLSSIMEAFPELNLYWLMTGKGKMLNYSPKKLPPAPSDHNLSRKYLAILESYIPPAGAEDYRLLKIHMEKLIQENEYLASENDQIQKSKKEVLDKIVQLFQQF